MSTIVVIGTAHSEGGACTSEKLYEIIKEIDPEVVFCEASPEKLPQYLKRTDVNTPETNVIRRLIKEKSIEIVPVDVNEDPFDQRLEAMFELIKREMEEYLGATQMLFNETYLKGFPFLNSADCDKICRDKNSMEKYFININKMKYKGLSNFYSHWLKWNDLRENQWINLIHNYFTINKPKKAVFFVGAGHRYRLIDKIKNIKDNNKPFLDWDFFHFQ
ncbi:hypothetical protein [Aquimarina spinulae]|uniref:hypothetical protein n=1 Tax=Aquimarina spinulae TaxID=1192023 RepID=UPI000D54EC18|nr:hypothetical protein [Aquimarina spinulae]